jgi:hypothetical protein
MKEVLLVVELLVDEVGDELLVLFLPHDWARITSFSLTKVVDFSVFNSGWFFFSIVPFESSTLDRFYFISLLTKGNDFDFTRITFKLVKIKILKCKKKWV